MRLKTRVFSAVRWTATAAVFRALLNIIQVSVLARLLEPEDYGLMAIVTVLLTISSALSDLGVNSAYIQRQEVSPLARSSLYWLNVLVATGLTIMLVVSAPCVATFFRDERLASLLSLSASVVLISALGAQLRMRAEKTLNFRPVVLIEILGSVVGLACALSAALAGWGVYALVAGAVCTAAINTALFWLFLAQGWRPQLRLNWQELSPFMGFGIAVIANSLTRRISAGLDLLLGGRIIAAGDLGLYSVPRNITLQVQFLVNPIITRVGFPVISTIQRDRARVRGVYLATLSITSATNAPIYIAAAFFCSEILHLLLGDRWAGSTDLFRLLSIWAVIRSTANPMGSLLLGMGKANWALLSNIVQVILQIPVILIGASYGTQGLVFSMLLFQLLVFAPKWYFLVRPLTDVTFRDYVDAAIKPIILSVLAVAPAYFVSQTFEPPLVRLIAGVVIAAPLYIAFSYLFNRIWVLEMLRLCGYRGQH